MRPLLLALAMSGAAFAAGCQNFYVERLLTQDTGAGKLRQRLARTDEQLCHAKEIDAFQLVAAPDGATMDVWVVKAKAAPTKGTAILLHSLNDTKADFPFFNAAKPLAKLGYDVVLMDLRAHGRSGGKHVTYGAKEKLDLKATMDALVARKLVDERFYVFGSNLGAAVAIQYAAIDSRVKGVVAMGPYRDFEGIAAWQLRVLNPVMLPEDMRKHIAAAAKEGGFAPDDASAVLAVRKLACHLLLVHRIADVAVPLDHTQAIFDAATCPKELRLITPGPEEAAMLLVLEDWIAQRLDEVATSGAGLKGKSTSQPK